MKKDSTSMAAPVAGAVDEALTEVQQSFERLCLAAGIEALRSVCGSVIAIGQSGNVSSAGAEIR